MEKKQKTFLQAPIIVIVDCPYCSAKQQCTLEKPETTQLEICTLCSKWYRTESTIHENSLLVISRPYEQKVKFAFCEQSKRCPVCEGTGRSQAFALPPEYKGQCENVPCGFCGGLGSVPVNEQTDIGGRS